MKKPHESPEYRLRKYQELYTLAKEVFAEELARSARIENKAATYLSALTFILGIFGFFGKEIVGTLLPPQDCLSWGLLITLTALFILVILTWFTLFRILSVYTYATLPIPLDFFHNHTLATVYYGMAKGMQQHLEANREQGNEKGRLLDAAYRKMRAMILLLVIQSILFTARSWVNSVTQP